MTISFFKKIKEKKINKFLEGVGFGKLYLESLFFANLFYYSAYFCYYSWVSLHFLVLFIGPTALFGIIHESHYTISINFYPYLQYFQ